MCPAPKIKWRGEAQSCFRRCPPPPGFGIANRVYSIARGFMPSRDPDPERDEEEYSPEVVVEDDKYDLEWKEGLLNELQLYDADESIDVASKLHSDGCLFSFLRGVLSYKHACIRAKAAEVITTMVQSHPTSQQLVIEGNALQLLLRNFTTDLNATSSTIAFCGVSSCKTLRFRTIVAISALIRENKSGITVFQRENGYAALRKALISGSVCQRSATFREILNLIEYLLRENSMYNQVLDLRSSDDREVQEAAALSGLLLLAERKGGNSGQLVKNDDKPKQVVLQELPSAALPTGKKKKNRGSKKKKKPSVFLS